MRRRSRSHLLCALVFALMATPVPGAGRTARLLEVEPGAAFSFEGAEAAWRVRVDTALLTRGADRFRIETPDGLEFEVRRMGFERRGPGSVTWRGRLTDSRDSRAILSMEDGMLSGWLHTPFGQYELRPLANGATAMLRMSEQALAACGADRGAHPAGSPAGGAAAPAGTRAPLAVDSPSAIDVLALYTVEARTAAGGSAQIRSRVRLMIDIANEAFGNSRMNARLKLAHVAQSPFRELGNMRDNLGAFRRHPGVQEIREAHRADLVALIQSTDPDFCGIAYIMDQNDAGFSPYAYSLTSYSCLNTLVHEVGHNMGMEHDPANGNPPDEALFPWAFGHFVRHSWRTVMAYPEPCGSCIPIPHFSNPDVLYEGQPTGLAGERDNARVGDRTAGTIANFRRSGVVLADDFESGGFSVWRANRGALTLLRPGLEGGYLLNIPMGSADRRFLVHRVSGSGKALDIEFLFNANGVELGGAEVDLLGLFSRGRAHTKLVLEQADGKHRLRLMTQERTGDFVEVGSTPVRALTTETIRIEWRGATAADLADGSVRLTKNGANRGTLRDLANHRWLVREVRLGLPHGAEGTPTRGQVYVDNYTASVPLDPQ